MSQLILDIIQAVIRLQATTLSTEERRLIQQNLMCIKDNNDSSYVMNVGREIILQAANSVNSKNDCEHCFVFGLTLLKESFSRDWASKPIEVQSSVIEWLLPLIIEPQLLISSAIISLCGQILSLTARSTWPQNWPGLLPTVLGAPNQSQQAVGICMLCELGQDITSSDSVISVANRKKILQGFIEYTPALLGAIQTSTSFWNGDANDWVGRCLMRSSIELIALLAEVLSPQPLLVDQKADEILIQAMFRFPILRGSCFHALQVICTQIGIKKGVSAPIEVMPAVAVKRLLNNLCKLAIEATESVRALPRMIGMPKEMYNLCLSLAHCFHSFCERSILLLAQRNMLFDALDEESLSQIAFAIASLSGVPSLDIIYLSISSYTSLTKHIIFVSQKEITTKEQTFNSIKFLHLETMFKILFAHFLYIPPPFIADADSSANPINMQLLCQPLTISRRLILGDAAIENQIFGANHSEILLRTYLETRDEAPPANDREFAEAESQFISDSHKIKTNVALILSNIAAAGPQSALALAESIGGLFVRLNEAVLRGELESKPSELGVESSRIRISVQLTPVALTYGAFFNIVSSTFNPSFWKAERNLALNEWLEPFVVAISEGEFAANDGAPPPRLANFSDVAKQGMIDLLSILKSIMIACFTLPSIFEAEVKTLLEQPSNSTARAKVFANITVEMARIGAVSSLAPLTGSSPPLTNQFLARCFSLIELPESLETVLGPSIDTKVSISKLRTDSLQCLARFLRTAPVVSLPRDVLELTMSRLNQLPSQWGVVQATICETVKRASKYGVTANELSTLVSRLAWPASSLVCPASTDVSSLMHVVGADLLSSFPPGRHQLSRCLDSASEAANSMHSLLASPNLRSVISSLGNLSEIIIASNPNTDVTSSQEGKGLEHPLSQILYVLYPALLRLAGRLLHLTVAETPFYLPSPHGDALRELGKFSANPLFAAPPASWPSPIVAEQEYNTITLFPPPADISPETVLLQRKQFAALRQSIFRVLSACGVWVAQTPFALRESVSIIFGPPLVCPFGSVPLHVLSTFLQAFSSLFCTPAALIKSPYLPNFFFNSLAIPFLRELLVIVRTEFAEVKALAGQPLEAVPGGARGFEFRIASLFSLSRTLASTLSTLLTPKMHAVLSQDDLKESQPSSLSSVHCKMIFDDGLLKMLMQMICELMQVAIDDDTQHICILAIKSFSTLITSSGTNQISILEAGSIGAKFFIEKYFLDVSTSQLARPLNWSILCGGSQKCSVWFDTEWLQDSSRAVDDCFEVLVMLYTTRVKLEKKPIAVANLSQLGGEITQILRDSIAPLTSVTVANGLLLAIASEDRDKLDRKKILRGIIGMNTNWLDGEEKKKIEIGLEALLSGLDTLRGAKRASGIVGK